MADPTKYTPAYSYSGWQASNPSRPLPADEVDNDFANVSRSVNQTIDALKDVRRSDGKLKNQSVGPDQLSPALTIGFTFTGTWVDGHSYSAGDGVVKDDTFYSAKVAHTADVSNAPGNDAYWNELYSLNDIVVTGGMALPRDSFVGDGVTKDFTLSFTPLSKFNLFVQVGGVVQATDAYSSNGNTVTFLTPPPNGYGIEVRGFATVSALVTPEDGSVSTDKLADYAVTDVKVAQTSALGRRILDVAYLTDPQFGALYGADSPAAASANATALSAFLHHCANNKVKGVIPAGDLYLAPVDVTAISGDLEIECNARIINQAGAAATQRLLMVDGIGTGSIKWRGGRFDQNGGAFSCLEIADWVHADAYIDEAYGITCTTSSTTSTSGLVLANVRKGLAGWDYMHDMDEGTSVQGSLPRCFSVSVNDATRSDCDVFIGRCEDVHGVIVVGDMFAGEVNTYGGVVRNAFDNGIYNVGNASIVTCHDINVDGIDELFVNSGSGELIAHRPIQKNALNAIGLQNCPAVRIFDGYLHFADGVNPFKNRSTNTASGTLEVRRTKIICTPAARVVGLGDVGTTEEFIDIGNDWTIYYKLGVTTASTSLTMLNMTAGTRCRVQSDSRWALRLAGADPVPDNTVWFINVPTVTELSYWKGEFINLLGNNTSYIRLNNARQQLFTFEGFRSQTNTQREMEINTGALASAPPREVYGDGPPTAGYWQAGSRVWNIAPTAGGTLGWVCVTAGTPGTWKVFGSVAA